jgi:hypothetical protein
MLPEKHIQGVRELAASYGVENTPDDIRQILALGFSRLRSTIAEHGIDVSMLTDEDLGRIVTAGIQWLGIEEYLVAEMERDAIRK